jgi:hypothetical protein
MFLMTLYKCGLTLYQMGDFAMPIWKLFLPDGVVWFVLVFGPSSRLSFMLHPHLKKHCLLAAGGSEVLIWTSSRQTLKQLLVV